MYVKIQILALHLAVFFRKFDKKLQDVKINDCKMKILVKNLIFGYNL